MVQQMVRPVLQMFLTTLYKKCAASVKSAFRCESTSFAKHLLHCFQQYALCKALTGVEVDGLIKFAAGVSVLQ